MGMNELLTSMPANLDSEGRDSHDSDSSEGSSVSWAPALGAGGQVQRFEVYEAQIFRFALAHAGGCVSRAAELLGVGRATMYRKMRAYKIVAPPVSQRAIDRSRRGNGREESNGAHQAA
jgi:DNA-binding NtrC family response regulator